MADCHAATSHDGLRRRRTYMNPMMGGCSSHGIWENEMERSASRVKMFKMMRKNLRATYLQNCGDVISHVNSSSYLSWPGAPSPESFTAGIYGHNGEAADTRCHKVSQNILKSRKRQHPEKTGEKNEATHWAIQLTLP